MFWGLLLGATLLRLGISPFFPLAMDEAYYWSWSRHLSLSYYDHPPFVAYLIFLTNALFGTSEFSIRLGTVLFGAGITTVMYAMGKTLFKNERTAFYAALVTTVIPIFSVGGIIITPDTPQAFFWVLSMYLFYEAVEKEDIKRWILGGVATGFCFLSKYTGLFLIPSLGLYFLLSPSKRKWIARPGPYISLFIAFCLFSPVIIWNMERDWVSFGFQFSHGFSQKSWPGIKGLVEYLGTQAGVISPLLFIGIMAGVLAAGHIGTRKRRDPYLYLFVMSFPMFFFFSLLSMKSRLEANWPLPCYFGGILAMCGFYVELLEKGKVKPWLKKSAVASVSLAAVLTSLLYLLAVYPVVILPKIEEIHFGWEQLGPEVANIVNTMPGGGENTFIFSSRHQVAGELAFYVTGRPRTYQIQGKKRYDYDSSTLSALKGKNGVYVIYKEEEAEEMKRYFDSWELARVVPIKKSGKLLRTFRIYRCYNYKGGLIEV